MSKICTQCKVEKDLSEFDKKTRAYDGLTAYCKDCDKARKYKYNGTKEGILTELYSAQKYKSKQRGMNPPEYTKEELGVWLNSEPEFDSMLKVWLASDRKQELKPSIDRKNDYEGYKFGNIQLMTWGDNNLKGYKDRVVGKNNKVSKPICQYDIDGTFIKEYHSISEATRQTGVNGTHIANVAKGKANTAKGYVWKFKN